MLLQVVKKENKMTLLNIEFTNGLPLSLENGREEKTMGCNGTSISNIYDVVLNFNASKRKVAEIIYANDPIFAGEYAFGTFFDAEGNKCDSYILASPDIISATYELLEYKFCN